MSDASAREFESCSIVPDGCRRISVRAVNVHPGDPGTSIYQKQSESNIILYIDINADATFLQLRWRRPHLVVTIIGASTTLGYVVRSPTGRPRFLTFLPMLFHYEARAT